MNRLPAIAALRQAAARLALAVMAWNGLGEGRAEEGNFWPAWVEQRNEQTPKVVESWSAVGPLFFSRPDAGTSRGSSTAEPGRVAGFRPFYVWKETHGGELREAYGLYPLLTYRRGETGSERWSVLNLINFQKSPPAPIDEGKPGAVPYQGFDVWPFYFSRSTGNEALDYRAVFPLAGTVKHRFGQDRLSWVLFPLYGRFEKNNVTTTTAPWPFIKVMRGEGNFGNEFWPLYGERHKAGAYHERFVLWPFFYQQRHKLWKEQPDEKWGLLPFYALDRSEGYISETWGWPFFGYVDRTQPYRYHARHYFWPLLVQGRGDDRYVNRWAPFYTHSVIKGTDKQWIVWPLWRRLQYQESGVDQTKRQLLYFLYNSTEQRSLSNPAAAPARKTHVWPLISTWNNGAGHRQVQLLSPFEVFFPQNEPVKWVWSPLAAIYRYDHRPDGEVRHSVLWNGVTYHRRPQLERTAFNLGPLLSVDSGPNERRVALIRGLFGFKRGPGQRGWRPFFGEFKRVPSSDTSPTP
ncbi:MAG TPA: hypothetical protein PLN52_16615 [Opitutaceae bacterium]|nr:hypothetical protein [Opitutaceae bacterium]